MLRVLKIFAENLRLKYEVGADEIITNLPDDIEDIMEEQIYRIEVPRMEETWRVYVDKTPYFKDDLREPLRACLVKECDYVFAIVKRGVKIDSAYTDIGRFLLLHSITHNASNYPLIRLLEELNLRFSDKYIKLGKEVVGEFLSVEKIDLPSPKFDSGYGCYVDGTYLEIGVVEKMTYSTTLYIYKIRLAKEACFSFFKNSLVKYNSPIMQVVNEAAQIRGIT